MNTVAVATAAAEVAAAAVAAVWAHSSLLYIVTIPGGDSMLHTKRLP